MLFDFKENNTYDLDNYLNYFNLDTTNNYVFDKKSYDKKEDLDLEKGFFLGNSFNNLYKPYKNYKSKRINAYSEQQKMLLRLQELDFYLIDLGLYLDIHPNDKRTYEAFKKMSLEYEVLKKKYYDKYQVLELESDNKDRYTWIDNPWPWDGGYYV